MLGISVGGNLLVDIAGDRGQQAAPSPRSRRWAGGAERWSWRPPGEKGVGNPSLDFMWEDPQLLPLIFRREV